MIRRAKIEDAERVAELGMNCIHSSWLPSGKSDECVDFCRSLIESDEGVAFLSDDGAIMGLLLPLFYRTVYLRAIEIFWWSPDGQGFVLAKAFEKWAVEKGAEMITLTINEQYNRPALGKVMQRKGFTKIETTYQRMI